ncbi:transposase [Thioalkalivibrio sp. ALMg11]|uniref:transposase n=1 Tax=Thioalkalivibrio sp. ALMg11 TaxID=1158165 RepID=UPI0004778588|nr:transposase [Thioalkalivibrio sp. ALMg11]
MPRMARVVLPHMPHHVVQRGHNRKVVFAEDEDYERYLEDLRELSSALDIRVYAYCLMTNHVHLLLGPGEEVAAMGRLMKALAARATRYRNRLEGRSGTLWEGRYKSSPVQTETYLLACTRYIELNPVRAQMAPAAGAYPWSSYRQRMGEAECWIDLDPAYRELADDNAERRVRYARFVEQGVPEQELSLMREALQRGQLTGNQRFVDEVEQIIGCRVERRRPGRPPSRQT